MTFAVTVGPWFSRAPVPTGGVWPVAAAGASSPAVPRRALLIVVQPTTFRGFMNVPAVRQLARAGGAGLVATNQAYRGDLRTVSEALLAGSGPTPGAASAGTMLLALAQAQVPVCGNGLRCLQQPDGLIWLAAGEASPYAVRGLAERAVLASPNADTLIIVLSVQPSVGMNRAGDEVTPIVMAQGVPAKLFPANGPMRSLTSDTTRYPGLVANVDVAPTILSFFHVPEPSTMTGSPIRVTGSNAPFALDRRQIQQRTIRVPVQLAEVVLVSIAGAAVILGLVAIDRRGGPSVRASRWWRALIVFMTALPIPLALGGLLPSYTYAWVLPWVLMLAGGLSAIAIAVRWPGSCAPLSFVGAAGLIALAADLVLGGHGLRVPLLGGTMFDGVRMYGLPNAFISTLLASGLFVAVRAGPARGGILLLLCGCLAGFPGLGADIGGSITLFAAAGLWWQLGGRGRLGVRELAVAAAVTVAGLALVLFVSRFLTSAPTHATRFVERSGSSPSSALDEVRHRLGVGVSQVAHYPVSLIPLLGLPVMLWAALRGPGIIGRGLAAAPGWRDVVIVLALSAAVAYIANDTGMAAAAPSFLYGMAALAYPAFDVTRRGAVADAAARDREVSAT